MKKIGLLLSFLFVGTSALMAQTKAEKAVATAAENLRLAILNADKPTLEKNELKQLRQYQLARLTRFCALVFSLA